jgi:L-lysine 2,3-aminomutase
VITGKYPYGKMQPRGMERLALAGAQPYYHLEQLKQVIELTAEEAEGVEKCLQHFRMAITPYYATDRSERSELPRA